MQDSSPNIIVETARFWTERAGRVISAEESRQIIENMAGFFRVLSDWDAKERSDSETTKQQATLKSVSAGRNPH
jgi:hypothetical protein